MAGKGVSLGGHLSPRAGAERPSGRRLLSADRPRSFADLLARRNRESRPWGVLRDRGLSGRDAGALDRIWRALSSHPRCSSPCWACIIERCLFPKVLPVGPDPEPASDLRSRDDHRAEPADDLRRGSPAVLDPARAPGTGLRRRLHLSALSPHHLRRGARGGHRHLVPGLPHRLRPRRARRRAESRTWWERSASRSSPT